MLTTSILKLPYPERPDTADVPRDIKALADKLEANDRICMVERNASVSLPSGSTASSVITFPTVVYDPHSMYIPSGTGGGRITLPVPGIWQVKASVLWAESANGVRHLDLLTESPTFTSIGDAGGETKNAVTSGAGYDLPMNLTSIWKTSVANEHILLYAWHVSTGSLSLLEASLSVVCLRNLA